MSREQQFINALGRALDRKRAKAEGRAATIRRLLAREQELEAIVCELLLQRLVAQRWIRGEFADTDLGDPMAGNPWACMWCGAMIEGGRAAARAHVQECEQNPLVQRIRELERTLP